MHISVSLHNFLEAGRDGKLLVRIEVKRLVP